MRNLGEGSLLAPGGWMDLGTLYSSLTQRPRSTSLQRSEQKGRNGLSFHSTGLPQIGHFIEAGVREPTSLRRPLRARVRAIQVA